MIDILRIERFCYSLQGTFGRMTFRDFECYTVERPWENNEPNVSCIPCGLFELKPTRYNRGGYDTLEIIVPGRTLIKIHIGNTIGDSLGCPLVGAWLGYTSDMWAVIDSTRAFGEFEEYVMPSAPAAVSVSNAVGGAL